MLVSFLMPLYNAEKTVGGAIQSILDMGMGSEYEIVIVDDGSKDGSAETVKQYQERNSIIKLIQRENGGEAAALNTGLPHCQGKYIALSEADIELSKDWFTEIIKEFDNSEVMGAGGILTPFTKDPWIARLHGYDVKGKMLTKPHFTNHITSANAIYKREIFDEIGNFKEELINASLDSDFNQRIVSKGHKLAFSKRAMARHHYKPTLLGYLSRHYAYARYRLDVKSVNLYPADRFLAVKIGLTGLWPLTFAAIPLTPFMPLYYALSLILLEIPQTIGYFRTTQDPVLMLFPFVAFLRNLTGVLGIGMWFLRGKSKPKQTVTEKTAETEA